jgi:hypothetical protein
LYLIGQHLKRDWLMISLRSATDQIMGIPAMLVVGQGPVDAGKGQDAQQKDECSTDGEFFIHGQDNGGLWRVSRRQTDFGAGEKQQTPRFA